MKVISEKLIPFILLAITFAVGFHLGKGTGPCDFEHRGRRPEAFAGRLADRLSLSPDQRKQVEQIMERRRSGFQNLRSEIRAQFEKMHEETRNEIRGVLTDDQKAQFEKLKEERHGFRRWRKRDGGEPFMGGPPPPE